ncbi:hypothetical protein BCR33DRAFT_847265 [Rhizoclosmatium globosum]|uniref:Uncharacterized protein n=1 Tax=Rhizoclosmatium globosum TaxID=329046 RepID=A0A1Y2CT14_9FUNG|nr:hypothetical protein BCR33DRAFT_847265 [Rhizoclosmatium globosum]|eukprot:ORY50036.1 hypothetical protein BCR33DRAFT_847265 [Rhizoclosmatium globosum]
MLLCRTTLSARTRRPMFHHVPQRSFVSVIDGFAQVFTMLHSAGLPWGTAVIVGTIAFRVAFTAPIAVVQRRRVERLAAIQPVVPPGLGNNAQALCQAADPVQGKGEPALQAKQLPSNSHFLATLGASSPLSVCIIGGEEAGGLPPWAFGGSAAAAVASDSTGVTSDIASSPLSASDTTSITTNTIDPFLVVPRPLVPDPTVLLPLIVGGLHLANIESHTSSVTSPTPRQRAFKLLFQSIAVLMVPVATQVPAGVALYWASSAGYSLVQNYVLQKIYTKPKTLTIPKDAVDTLRAKL